MPSHATLYDFRDLDLMLKLEDEANEEGWIETEHMARALGFDDDRKPIGSRFSWMRRYGMLERDDERKMWRLTDAGRRVVTAKLRAATSREIEALEDEAFVDVMAKVGQRYRHGSPMIAHMLRREFLYGTAPR
jgi:hypothetical protein